MDVDDGTVLIALLLDVELLLDEVVVLGQELRQELGYANIGLFDDAITELIEKFLEVIEERLFDIDATLQNYLCGLAYYLYLRLT